MTEPLEEGFAMITFYKLTVKRARGEQRWESTVSL
jgi:hypothetical protein